MTDDDDRISNFGRNFGKHWISSPVVGGWDKRHILRHGSLNHHAPYTDGPDLIPPIPPSRTCEVDGEPMSLGDLQHGFQIIMGKSEKPPRLFLNRSDTLWLRTILGTPVVHDPAPPPTLDGPAVTGYMSDW